MLTRPILLYDRDCEFCRTWIRRLERWDVHQRIQCLPSTDRSTVADLPLLSDEALNRAMHLITPDGQVFAGGRAEAAGGGLVGDVPKPDGNLTSYGSRPGGCFAWPAC